MNPVTSTQPNAQSLRVYTLGRFVIERDGEPLGLGGKSQRKPLDLLKLLIALGGQSISTEKLSEALWPDSDGDRAQGAFSTTLHRLRKLIGPDGLKLANSRLTLDSALCWVDAWAFGDLVQQAGGAIDETGGDDAWRFTEQALALYGGPFLDGEFDLAEVLTTREKLHGQFLRHVISLGKASSAAGEHGKAIALYQKGLEIDELAEEFYQNLMRCLQSEGRTAEAKTVFERCKQTLNAAAGAEPSPETEAIAEALDSAKSHPSTIQETAADANPSAPRSSGEKPSIAIMPFENLSSDPEQEFFADGLVEEILTSLSKVSSMTVIARNSTFAYRGIAIDVRQVAQDLDVRFIVEGSVRKSGERLRVTAQLIDSADGSHIWAERYDRVVEDIFDIQDEITKEIVTALRVNLTDSERALILSRGTNNVQAWGYCVQALEFFYKFNAADHARAREFAEQSLQLDPDYAVACAILGWTHWFDSRAGYSGGREEALSRAKALAKKAMSLDGANPFALGLNSFVQVSLRNFDAAKTLAEKTVALNPASAHARLNLAFTLLHCGRPEEAISTLEDVVRLNPWHPVYLKSNMALALDSIGRTEEALEMIDAVLKQNPKHFAVLLLQAAVLSREDRIPEAKRAVGNLKRENPSFRLAHVSDYLIMRDQDYVDSLIESLRLAGLPE